MKNWIIEVPSYRARIAGLKSAAAYWLHDQLDPHPYHGDIENAKVILLFANPSYG